LANSSAVLVIKVWRMGVSNATLNMGGSLTFAEVLVHPQLMKGGAPLDFGRGSWYGACVG
jgi:hypothetical protein